MGYTLLIVESPAKCKKIEGYLGAGYKCIASFGHIRQISNGLKSIDYNNNYKVTFKTSPNKGKYITALRKAIGQAHEVILATDDDREGEAIAWHIVECLKPKVPVKRLVFNEITKFGNSIMRAIHYPVIDNTSLGERAGAHEDINLITLLVAGTGPGLEARDKDGTWHKLIHGPDKVLEGLPSLTVSKHIENDLNQGRPIDLEYNVTNINRNEQCRVYTTNGRFLAVISFSEESGQWHPEQVFNISHDLEVNVSASR